MKRFYKAMIILTALGLQACPETPVKSDVVGNGVKLDILFEHDGCRVYRFYDYKDPHYFTDCRGSISDRRSCGKGCTKEYSIETVK